MKNEADIITLIEGWRTKFGLPVRTEIKVPAKGEILLALRLIDEEVEELLKELTVEYLPKEVIDEDETNWIKDDISINQVADAVADILFVAVQMANIFGLNPREIIQKVYDSNMTKLCYSSEEVAKTIAKYKDQGIDVTSEEIEPGVYIIKRTWDNKLLKGINFKEPEWNYDK